MTGGPGFTTCAIGTEALGGIGVAAVVNGGDRERTNRKCGRRARRGSGDQRNLGAVRDRGAVGLEGHRPGGDAELAGHDGPQADLVAELGRAARRHGQHRRGRRQIPGEGDGPVTGVTADRAAGIIQIVCGIAGSAGTGIAVGPAATAVVPAAAAGAAIDVVAVAARAARHRGCPDRSVPHRRARCPPSWCRPRRRRRSCRRRRPPRPGTGPRRNRPRRRHSRPRRCHPGTDRRRTHRRRRHLRHRPRRPGCRSPGTRRIRRRPSRSRRRASSRPRRTPRCPPRRCRPVRPARGAPARR